MRKLLAVSVLIFCTSCSVIEKAKDVLPYIESYIPYLEVNQAPRTAVILAVNDTYRIDGINDGTVGGFARLRTLRRELEISYPDLLLLNAGDFLFPSQLSEEFYGEHVVDVMNVLDGDMEAMDERMFVTFGNHEFDKGALCDAGNLKERIDQSQFYWLSSNINFLAVGGDRCPMVVDPDEPFKSDNHIEDFKIITVGGVDIGLFSLTIDSAKPAYVDRFLDYSATAVHYSDFLRRRGAEVVVALTHLKIDQDKALLESLGATGPDLIIGGHEHEKIFAWVKGSDGIERLVVKAASDAVSATEVHITVSNEGRADIKFSHHELDSSVAVDAQVQGIAGQWLQRFEYRYCHRHQLGPRCLNEELAQTATSLIGEELKIRRFETNLGNWVLDTLLSSYNEGKIDRKKADIAFVNSGSLRLNENIPPGAVRRVHIEGLLPYPVIPVVITITGEKLKEILQRSVENWTGNGHWLQVAGFRFEFDPSQPVGNQIANIQYANGAPISDNDRLRAVTSEFLVGEVGGGCDGYSMICKMANEATGLNLKTLLIDSLEKNDAIDYYCDGRIKNLSEQWYCPERESIEVTKPTIQGLDDAMQFVKTN